MNKALRKARRGAGLTMAQLACEAGLPAGRGAIYDLETGRTRMPAHDTAVLILDALAKRGVDADLLARIFPVRKRQAVAA